MRAAPAGPLKCIPSSEKAVAPTAIKTSYAAPPFTTATGARNRLLGRTRTPQR